MTISALSAAKTLCELRDWKLSNLELQKILYVAQMVHLSRTGGSPLIEERFEAWDYGPVVPKIYQRAKAFGNSPVRNVFNWEKSAPITSNEYKSLRDAAEMTRGLTAGQLVSMTHRQNGAWYNSYIPGIRGIEIPNSSILAEYRERTAVR